MMKVSRRMQRQVEIKIRHGLAQEISQSGTLAAAPERHPSAEKTREEGGSAPR